MAKKPKEPTSLQRARKAHAERLRAAGFKPTTFWKSWECSEALAKLSAESPKASVSDIINAAVVAFAEPIAAKTSEKAEGRREDPKPTKTPAKIVKAVSDAPAQTAGHKLDVPFGPQPFQSRLKGLQKGKAK